MANLSVRNLDNNVYKSIRLRAVEHGISMEEEVRRILVQAVVVPQTISAVFREYFGPEKGIELNLPRKPHEPMDFQE